MMMGVFTQSLCLHCKLITLSSRSKVLQYCLDYQLHFPMFVLVNSHINKNPQNHVFTFRRLVSPIYLEFSSAITNFEIIHFILTKHTNHPKNQLPQLVLNGEKWPSTHSVKQEIVFEVKTEHFVISCRGFNLLITCNTTCRQSSSWPLDCYPRNVAATRPP